MTARQMLWETAVDQYGYFTLRDAAALGIDRQTVAMLAHRHSVERAATGVYRFPELPVTEFDTYELAVLWTGCEEACLSHDTALAAYDVCDINPERIHVTVGKNRRIRRRGGSMYEVHYEDLAPAEIGWWQQIPTVHLPVAIMQCIRGGVPTYLLRQAIDDGGRRGVLSPADQAMLGAELEGRHGRRTG